MEYQVAFLSDWHIGTGAGVSGSVDRLVARDQDGLPFVPAKTMTGIWRDAAERLARGLDRGEFGSWTEFVATLFGDQPSTATIESTPRPSVVSIRPARFDSEFRSRWGGLSVADSLGVVTVVRASTAIDSVKGVAKDRTLRTIEMGRAGSRLHGSLTLDLDETVDEVLIGVITEFLRISAGLIEGIGGSRRRGAGRCAVELLRPTPVRALEDLPMHAPAIPTARSNSQPQFHQSAFEVNEGWRMIELDLMTRLPVIMASGVRGNEVETADRLLGRSLLAAVCGVLRDAGVPADDMVAHGRLSVSEGTPLSSGRLCWPTPFALTVEKHAFGTDSPRILNSLSDVERGRQTKQLRSGWVADLGGDSSHRRLLRHMVTTIARTHSTIDDRIQRPSSDVGGVFTYYAIDAGQSFRCRIGARCDETTAGQIIDALARAGEFSFGVSRKDDYGSTSIEVVREVPLHDEGQHHKTLIAGESLTVWCVSDVVLVDDLLRFSPTADRLAGAIESVLELPPGTLVVEPESVRLRTTRLDAWNATWSLPHTTIGAIAAGSVVRFVVHSENGPVEIDDRHLDELELLGVGERRSAGFGRLVLDSPILSADSFDAENLVPEGTEMGSASIDGSHLSEMEKQIIEAQRRRSSTEWSVDHGAA
jgi:CRISPR-associated protein Csx10